MSDLDALAALHDAGWNWYRDPARARADDALARARAADLLATAMARLTKAEAAARRAIPAPTREAPLPDPALLAQARALKALRDRVAALESRLRGSAAPPHADATSHILPDAACAALVAADAELLREAAACAVADDAALPARLAALEAILARRADLLAWR